MIQRFLALDGIRFVLVMCVLGHHAVLPGFKGGFIAVDSFFVLSGFVISLLVCNQIKANEFSWGKFMSDRFIRLWPALFLTLTCCTPFIYLFGKESPSAMLEHAMFAMVYSTNIERALSIGNANLYFGHMWSLSMEWQFYVAWSIAAFAGLKIFNKKPLAAVRAICIASLIISMGVVITRGYSLNTGTSFIRIYFGPEYRADGVLLGCALGAAYSIQSNAADWLNSKITLPLGLLSFTLLMWYCSASENNYITWGIPLINATSALLIVGCIYSQGPIVNFLSSRWLTLGGRLSYGIYLWHYPIFRLLDDFGLHSSVAIILIGGLLSASCSWLSMKYIEPTAKVLLLRRFRTTQASSR